MEAIGCYAEKFHHLLKSKLPIYKDFVIRRCLGY